MAAAAGAAVRAWRERPPSRAGRLSGDAMHSADRKRNMLLKPFAAPPFVSPTPRARARAPLRATLVMAGQEGLNTQRVLRTALHPVQLARYYVARPAFARDRGGRRGAIAGAPSPRHMFRHRRWRHSQREPGERMPPGLHAARPACTWRALTVCSKSNRLAASTSGCHPSKAGEGGDNDSCTCYMGCGMFCTRCLPARWQQVSTPSHTQKCLSHSPPPRRAA